MASDHDCMDHRKRVQPEGWDTYVEQCARCGRVRMESRGNRPMAWFRHPFKGWPWRYAYADPRNDPDSPEVFEHLPNPDVVIRSVLGGDDGE